MPIRPSIIITCGTSAGEVGSLLYIRHEALAQRGVLPRDNVQFLAIDSDEPATSALAELRNQGRFFSISWANPHGLLDAMAKDDPFFERWWYPGFKKIGPMFPGMGTVPIKGRLGFWATLGTGGTASRFAILILGMLRNARNLIQGGADQEKATVAAYIISTVAGGTGSGIYLDVAHYLRGLPGTGPLDIIGVLMLPSLPLLRALPDKREQIQANGSASLRALDAWLAQERPRHLMPFIERPGLQLTGEQAPFDLCYLITEKNEDGKNLSEWSDYARLVADGLADEIMTETDTLSRRAEFIQGVTDRGEVDGRPAIYASYSVAGIRFDHAKITRYLGYRYGELALAEALKQSNLVARSAELVRTFVTEKAIRERSTDLNVPVDEVIEKLNAGHPEYATYPDVAVDEELRNLRIERDGVHAAVDNLMHDAKARLSGAAQGVNGVPLIELFQQNRQRWLDHLVRGEPVKVPSDTAWTLVEDGLSLYDKLAQFILTEKEGLHLASQFLSHLKNDIASHAVSIEEELVDAPERNRFGDRHQIKHLEGKESRDVEEEELGRAICGLLAPFRREGGIRAFVEKWWNPWLAAQKRVMVKEEVLRFYQQLTVEVHAAEQVLKQLRMALEGTKSDLDFEAQRIFGRRFGPLSYVLDEPVLEDPAYVKKVWLDEGHEEALLANAALALPGYLSQQAKKHLEMIPKDLRNRAVAAQPVGFEESEPADAYLGHVDAELQQMRDKLIDLLVQRGRNYFERQERVANLSVWDALKLEAELAGKTAVDDIVLYIQEKVRRCLKRCAPFWETNGDIIGARGLAPSSSVTMVLDSTELEVFSKRLGASLNLSALFQESQGVTSVVRVTDVIQEETRGGEDRYNMQVRVAHGGYPLSFLLEPGRLQKPFDDHRRQKGESAPVFTDRRHERLLEGPLLNFLLAEQLEVIDSPFVKSNGKNTSGPYLYRKETLGNSRVAVIDALRQGEVRHELLNKIVADVAHKQSDKRQSEIRDLLLCCWARLMEGKTHQRGALRKQLDVEIGVIEREIESAHKINHADIPAAAVAATATSAAPVTPGRRKATAPTEAETPAAASAPDGLDGTGAVDGEPVSRPKAARSAKAKARRGTSRSRASDGAAK